MMESARAVAPERRINSSILDSVFPENCVARERKAMRGDRREWLIDDGMIEDGTV